MPYSEVLHRRRVIAGPFAVLLVLAAMVSFIIAIWLRDGRWAAMGAVFCPPMVFCALMCVDWKA